MSGADTYLLCWDGKRAGSLVVSNIWISDKERPELAQAPVVACTNMPQADFLAFRELAECLVMVSEDEIIMSSLQTSPTTVPHVKLTDFTYNSPLPAPIRGRGPLHASANVPK